MSGPIDYARAAVVLGVKVGTLRSMVSRGQVPHIRLSPRLVVFDIADLQAHLDAHRVAAGGAR